MIAAVSSAGPVADSFTVVVGAVVDDVGDAESDGTDDPDADPVVVDDCDADVDAESEPSSVHALTASRPVTSTAPPPRDRRRVTVRDLLS